MHDDETFLVIIGAKDDEITPILKAIKKPGLNRLKDRIFIFDVKDTIYEDNLFVGINMLTIYHSEHEPISLGLNEFKENYGQWRDKLVTCIKDNNCSDVEALGGDNLVQLVRNLDTKAVDKKATYAAVLGYDQANVLLEAMVNQPSCPSNEELRNQLEKTFYNGVLDVYFFTDANHDGTYFLTEVQHPPAKSIDQKWFEEGWLSWWSKDIKASASFGFSNIYHDPHAKNLSGAVNLSYVLKKGEFPISRLNFNYTFEPTMTLQYDNAQLENSKRLTRSLQGNIFALSIPVKYGWDDDPFVIITGSIGFAYTKIDTYEHPAERLYTVIYKAGIERPLGIKSLSLALDWERQKKLNRETSLITAFSTLTANLKITIPPK